MLYLVEPFLSNFELFIGCSRHNRVFACGYDATLQTVRVDDMRQTMHDHPSATFFGSVLVAVFAVHLFDGEVAKLVLEAWVVEAE